MSVKQLVVGCTDRYLASACISSIWRLVWRLSNKCLFLQHERRWRELSICLSGQKLQSCEMSFLRTCFLGRFPSIYHIGIEGHVDMKELEEGLHGALEGYKW